MKHKINPVVGERVYLPYWYDGHCSVPNAVAAVEKKGLATIVTLVPTDVWERKRDAIMTEQILEEVKSS